MICGSASRVPDLNLSCPPSYPFSRSALRRAVVKKYYRCFIPKTVLVVSYSVEEGKISCIISAHVDSTRVGYTCQESIMSYKRQNMIRSQHSKDSSRRAWCNKCAQEILAIFIKEGRDYAPYADDLFLYGNCGIDLSYSYNRDCYYSHVRVGHFCTKGGEKQIA